MKSVAELIEASRDPRLDRLPKYACDLIQTLAGRLASEARYAESAQRQAEKEVAEARTALLTGPEDSDTFLHVERSITLGYTEGLEESYRPLGKGVTVEFRRPGDEPGEGFEVRLTGDGDLEISGMHYLAVVPVNHSTIRIEPR